MIPFTEDERSTARNLLKSKETVAFLEKLFCPTVEQFEEELGKNVAALNDEDYGRLMKAVFIAKASFKLKMAKLKTLGAGTDKPAGPRAPK
jgi:hypothetical protein